MIQQFKPLNEITGRGSVGEAGLTTTHRNVIFTIGGEITNVLGNATYGEVILPKINGYQGSSIIGSMIRPYFGRAASGGQGHPLLVNLYVAKPLAPSTGDATVQDTAMIYIDAPMDETVGGKNYSIWVDNGPCRFDGGVSITGDTIFNGNLNVGGNITSGAGGPHTWAGKHEIKPAGSEKLLLMNTDFATGVGTKAVFYMSATSGNATLNIQNLNSGGNVAGKISINPNGGNVGFCGVASPTAKVHISAGATGAGTAPIKLTAGALNTTPEAGAIEFDGTNLYYTTSAGVRKTLAVVA
jgi:hypothetical protein